MCQHRTNIECIAFLCNDLRDSACSAFTSPFSLSSSSNYFIAVYTAVFLGPFQQGNFLMDSPTVGTFISIIAFFFSGYRPQAQSATIKGAELNHFMPVKHVEAEQQDRHGYNSPGWSKCINNQELVLSE
jgi:hypothetical protein